jgi:putative NADH-flavin reductase
MATSLDGTKGNIVIVGATGNTGLQLVEQALAQNYKVTAPVRSPEKLAHLENQHLEVNNLHTLACSLNDRSLFSPGCEM